jgi:predicted amidohydrolase YtcJ
LLNSDLFRHNDADGSVRVILDCIERVQKRIGKGTARHCLCHCGIVHPSDIPRFKELGVMANCTPIWGTNYDGIFHEIYTAKLGKDRMEERSYPYGDLVRSGVNVSYGADLPGVRLEEMPPLVQIQAAMTRKRPGFPDDPPLVERQKVTLEEALKCSTINGAYQMRSEDRVGSLEVGKRADLVVLGKNLFEVDVEEIYKVPVVLTMMDGKITFDRR